jgi:hypothetical protein
MNVIDIHPASRIKIRLIRLSIAAVLSVPLVPPAWSATAFYVATTGSDANPGTYQQPWRTIQKAADSATPGSTVFVRGGIYSERVAIHVSGSDNGGYVTFKNLGTERAIVDGTGLDVPEDDSGALIAIDGQHHVIIKGFELRNYRTGIPQRVPAGIQVLNAAHHIELRNNIIHHIEHTGTTPGVGQGIDAHGIAVYGYDGAQAIHDLIIAGNDLHSLVLGSSEALVLNGNVDGFRITNNTIHDSNNIGIDIAGFYQVSSVPATDRARNGVIADNQVYRISAFGNPAYENPVTGQQDLGADGIYVDGGTSITIERNILHHNNIGLELASEIPGGNTSLVTARNNFIYLNDAMGITLGGYEANTTGKTIGCNIVNNTLFKNDRLHYENGELRLNWWTQDNVIKNNVVYSNNQNYFLTNPFLANYNNVLDGNLYYTENGAASKRWQWKNNWYAGFAAYRAGTGQDAASRFVNPALVGTLSPLDLHLKGVSPAINVGQPISIQGALDIDRQPRINIVIDIGADEFY